MPSLASLVNSAIPPVSACSARVIEALVRSRGFTGEANGFARSLAFRNRDQLRRVLAADRLPCLEDLAGWIRVCGWLLDAEDSGLALSKGALEAGKDPGSCYRTVRRLTGKSWGEIRRLGSGWLLLEFDRALRAANSVDFVRASSA
jgi:hypothetical protein